MPKIKQLPLHEAHKIAAGEVVERPANIVKELIENAVDADASIISVYLEDGGKNLIRVIDNGCGMDEQDAQICFLKHATSKITQVDDLESINTFGFRGEALASIAAVGKVTLITKQATANQGTQVIVEKSEIIQVTPCAATTGTDIAVRDLFYTIPARKKFLKSRETEWRNIAQLIHAFCFAYPTIHFKVFLEGKSIINCPPADSIEQRFVQLQIITRPNMLLTIDSEQNGLRLAGIISHHEQTRYDRNGIYLFVNNRWVKDTKLANALLKGYRNILQNGQYPLAALAITLDPKQVDINIHPRKEEVRFLHPRIIEQYIEQCVKMALDAHLTQRLSGSSEPNPYHASTRHSTSRPFIPYNFDAMPPQSFTRAAYREQNNDTIQKAWAPQPHLKTEPTFAMQADPQQLILVANNSTCQQQAPIAHEPTPTIIGQIHTTYIIIEHDKEIFFVYQHAAHERILYEQFAARFKQVATVPLLFPAIISLSKDDLDALLPHLNLFTQNGITIEQFGQTQIVVQTTPVHLKNVSLEDLIRTAIGWIHEMSTLDFDLLFKNLNEKLHAQMACKAAVKAGDVLTHEHMHSIIRDLKNTPNATTCPHGRPTGWLLPLSDLEKKFKRDYQ